VRVKIPVIDTISFENVEGTVTVSLVILVMFIGASFLRTGIVWLTYKICANRQTEIASALYDSYLKKSLNWHNTNSPESLVSESLNEVKRTIEGTVAPLFQVCAQLIVILTVFGYLLYFDAVATIFLGVIFILVYGGVSLALRNYIKSLGLGAKYYLAKSLQILSVSFGSIRHVKTLQAEFRFTEAYRDAVHNSARQEGWAHILSHVPRYLVEATLVSAMFAVLFVRFNNNGMDEGQSKTLMETFAVFVFAAFRMLPAISIIQAAYANFNYVRSASSRVFRDLKVVLSENSQSSPRGYEATSGWAGEKHLDRIRFEDLVLCPDDRQSQKLSVQRLELVPHGLHAIVGPSGAGKSLLVECLSGLHTDGLSVKKLDFIFSDGEDVSTSDPRRLISYIAHSPQRAAIFSSDLLENLTFPDKDVDVSRDYLVSRMISLLGKTSVEQLANSNDLSKGGFPGEIRGSVGQKLGISILRTLSTSRPIIILDEPNSSFDIITDRAFFDLINDLSKSRGIYIVTHRLERLEDYLSVTFVARGEVKAIGQHRSLIKNCKEYQDFVNTRASE
jgi:ABC-type multidrug transport system fused ATPase/permease subunit